MDGSTVVDMAVASSATAERPSDNPPLISRSRLRASREGLFLEHLTVINGVIKAVSRRCRLSPTEQDEFASTVWMRLIEDDYRVLGEFRHQCGIRTFLSVVIQRMCVDYRNQHWGKWRSSAEAKRRGRTAILLERLLGRDGLTFDEAVETMQTHYRVAVSRDALWELAGHLRTRRRASRTVDEGLADAPDPAPLADALVARRQRRGEAARARRALRHAVMTLDTGDRELIRLRYGQGLRVADIARTLSVHQKPLYRRFEKVLGRLRRTLETDGAVANVVRGSLEGDWRELETCHL